MANIAGFDASQVGEMMEFSAIPEGQYVVIATQSEMKPTKNGQGQYLQFTFEVLDGQFKGRKLWTHLNLHNASQTAVDIAQRELGAICKAVGVIKPSDSSELHNLPMLVKVAVELNDKNQETNIIKKYEPAVPGVASAPVQPAAAAAPAPAFAQAAAPVVAAAPAAASVPPWQR